MRCDDRVRVVASLALSQIHVHAFIIHQHHIHGAQRRAPRDVDSVFCCPRKDRLNENGHATNLLRGHVQMTSALGGREGVP